MDDGRPRPALRPDRPPHRRRARIRLRPRVPHRPPGARAGRGPEARLDRGGYEEGLEGDFPAAGITRPGGPEGESQPTDVTGAATWGALDVRVLPSVSTALADSSTVGAFLALSACPAGGGPVAEGGAVAVGAGAGCAGWRQTPDSRRGHSTAVGRAGGPWVHATPPAAQASAARTFRVRAISLPTSERKKPSRIHFPGSAPRRGAMPRRKLACRATY